MGSFGVSVTLFALLLCASCTPSSAAPTDQESGGGGSVGQATAGQGGSAGDEASAGTSQGIPIAGSGGTGGSSAAAPRTITVTAGEVDRNRTITSFQLADATGKSFTLVDKQGGSIPMQVAPDGSAVFVLPELSAGQQHTYRVETSPSEPVAAVTAIQGADDVSLAIDGTKVLRFQAQGKLPLGVSEVYLRGGYIHPFYSPSGIPVTEDYPPTHIHHHGIWSAWTRAQFNGHVIDFWNMGDGLGKVDFKTLGQVWQGPVHSGFEADLEHIDLLGAEPAVALVEHWKVTAYKTHEGAAPYLVVDLESVQQAATAMPVLLEEYIYGGFGVRGRDEWTDTTKVTFLTSEGLDRLAGDSTNGRWVFIGGNIDGKVAGFAVLGHPENFRAPQPLRLHPTEPYASIAPPKAGPFSIEPGRNYITRFRIVSVDGAPDAALLDRLWDDYATPPSVQVD
jgi:hypothetical protein